MTHARTPPIPSRKIVAQWKRQRLSAAALIVLGIWFLIEILGHVQADYPAILAWASRPFVGIALALWAGMVFYHSALGLQVIIEDYVRHPISLRASLLMVKMFSLSLALLSWFFIIRILIMGRLS